MEINRKKGSKVNHFIVYIYIYSFYINSLLFNLKMKYSLVIVFLLIGVSHSFFGPIGQAINNAGNSVNSVTNNVGNSINSATNNISNSVHAGTHHIAQSIDNILNKLRDYVDSFIRELLNSANQLQSAANSLWDNVFSPVFDLLTKGKINLQLIPNDHLFSHRWTIIT